ncbi:MAG: LysE family transporter, partial [Desulfobacterales bacterium]|nr:LysE family transporter [Desulfobacterales bacterium]
LVYLGVRQWNSASAAQPFDAIQVSRANLFIQGLTVTIPNPKSLIFIAAFLPQFIDVTRPAGIQFGIIVPTFLIITFAVTSVWAVIAGNAAKFFHSQHALKTVQRSSAGLMIFTGLGLALARRGN